MHTYIRWLAKPPGITHESFNKVLHVNCPGFWKHIVSHINGPHTKSQTLTSITVRETCCQLEISISKSRQKQKVKHILYSSTQILIKKSGRRASLLLSSTSQIIARRLLPCCLLQRLLSDTQTSHTPIRRVMFFLTNPDTLIMCIHGHLF